jgi:hypothetical protein
MEAAVVTEGAMRFGSLAALATHRLRWGSSVRPHATGGKLFKRGPALLVWRVGEPGPAGGACGQVARSVNPRSEPG